MSVNPLAGLRDLRDERDRLQHDRDQWRQFALEWKHRVDKARELHDDPLTGVCPACISREDLQAGGNGLIDHPCPTHKALDPDGSLSRGGASWTGQDGLRAEIIRAIDDHARLPVGALIAAADAVLDKVQARIDAAREQVAGFDVADLMRALDDCMIRAERAEAAEQAVQRVRAVVDEWGDADPDRPNHGLWIAIRRALDGTP